MNICAASFSSSAPACTHRPGGPAGTLNAEAMPLKPRTRRPVAALQLFEALIPNRCWLDVRNSLKLRCFSGAQALSSHQVQ